MQIHRAKRSDLVCITALLAAHDLPTADLTRAHMEDFLVARKHEGVVGVIGLERLGESALIRSLIVAPSARGSGIGRTLLMRAEQMARVTGHVELWLLTSTARDFFQHQGYRVVDRSAVQEDVRRSAEFSLLCPDTAICMAKTL